MAAPATLLTESERRRIPRRNLVRVAGFGEQEFQKLFPRAWKLGVGDRRLAW